MATLHIENTVHDFAAWKEAFDKFSQLRIQKGVRSYRVSQSVTDLQHVTVDLDFDSLELAEQFGETLKKIWASPQSREALVAHRDPVILNVVEARTL